MSHLALITAITAKGAERHHYDAYLGYPAHCSSERRRRSRRAGFHRLVDVSILDLFAQADSPSYRTFVSCYRHDEHHGRRADWTFRVEALKSGERCTRDEDNFFPIQICEHILVDQRPRRRGVFTPRKPNDPDAWKADDEWWEGWLADAGYTPEKGRKVLFGRTEDDPERQVLLARWRQEKLKLILDDVDRYLATD